MTKEAIMKLQTYKLFEDGELLVCRDDVLKLLGQEPCEDCVSREAVLEHMRRLGYDAEDYPYWEREDGCKMLGEYIMVACNLKERPYGTIVATSLGYGIVCDTGRLSRYQVDIATNW